MSKFDNWPPRVDYGTESSRDIEAKPAKDAKKKKKPKKVSKERLKGGR